MKRPTELIQAWGKEVKILEERRKAGGRIDASKTWVYNAAPLVAYIKFLEEQLEAKS